MRYFVSEMNWENKTPNREEKTFSSLFNVEQGGKGILPLCLRSFTPMGGKRPGGRKNKKERNYNFEKEISIFRVSVAKNNVRNA